jgi:hypothetical protein
MKRSEELSTPAILGISIAIALFGLVAYGMLAPIAPAKLIALAHNAFNQPIAR